MNQQEPFSVGLIGCGEVATMRADGFFSRFFRNGKRRAGAMGEVARAIGEAGREPWRPAAGVLATIAAGAAAAGGK